MKKGKTKNKDSMPAEKTPARGQVVRLKPRKARRFRLPPVKEYWDRSRQFVVEAVQELRRVTWPSRKETVGTTAVVLLLVVVISVFLGLVDLGLSRLVGLVIPR